MRSLIKTIEKECRSFCCHCIHCVLWHHKILITQTLDWHLQQYHWSTQVMNTTAFAFKKSVNDLSLIIIASRVWGTSRTWIQLMIMCMIFWYLTTSGNHWAVSEGHSRAWVITKSYKNGVFFFHILYSSLMTLSSTSFFASLNDWWSIHKKEYRQMLKKHFIRDWLKVNTKTNARLTCVFICHRGNQIYSMIINNQLN